MEFQYSNYYAKYKGPNLLSIMIDNVENLDILKKIKKIYGNNNNWNKKIYTFRSVLDKSFLNKEIIFIYENTKSGIPNWSKYVFQNDYEIINPQLFTPMSLL